jgi:hypothetical protein
VQRYFGNILQASAAWSLWRGRRIIPPFIAYWAFNPVVVQFGAPPVAGATNKPALSAGKIVTAFHGFASLLCTNSHASIAK